MHAHFTCPPEEWNCLNLIGIWFIQMNLVLNKRIKACVGCLETFDKVKRVPRDFICIHNAKQSVVVQNHQI